MFPDFAFVGSIVSMNSISSLSSTPRLLACFKGKYFDSFIFKYLTMIFRNFLRIIGGSVWIWSMMSSSHWGKNFKHRGKFELISQISPYLIGKKNLIISPSFLRCLKCESQRMSTLHDILIKDIYRDVCSHTKISLFPGNQRNIIKIHAQRYLETLFSK